MKKILITGAFSTGKTSLIALVKEKLESFNKKILVFNEVARECPFDLNKKQDLVSSSWLVMRQLQNELQADTEDYDFVIFDRGLPDVISHVEYIIKDNTGKAFLDQLKLLASVSCDRFDYIFFSKISDEFIIEADELREVDRDYQRKLEKSHLDFLKQTKALYIELPETNTERLPFIISKLNVSL
jgi:predicted ATPase